MAETAPEAPRLEPGLIFNQPRRRTWWERVLAATATPVAMAIGVASASWIAGKPLDSTWMLALLSALAIGALLEMLLGGRPEHPIVEVAEGGLRVRGRLIEFNQIRSIEARKVSTGFAVVTFNADGVEGRFTLLAPWPSVQFRELLTEFAAKAGIELTLKTDVKARRPRLPKPAALAQA